MTEPLQQQDADRELLERLASQLGYEPRYWDRGLLVILDEGRRAQWWNPLTDDGDALRLAVKLRLDVEFFTGFGEIKVTASSVHDYGSAIEKFADDMGAATRRAIVKAAAALRSSLDALERA